MKLNRLAVLFWAAPPRAQREEIPRLQSTTADWRVRDPQPADRCR